MTPSLVSGAHHSIIGEHLKSVNIVIAMVYLESSNSLLYNDSFSLKFKSMLFGMFFMSMYSGNSIISCTGIIEFNWFGIPYVSKTFTPLDEYKKDGSYFFTVTLSFFLTHLYLHELCAA